MISSVANVGSISSAGLGSGLDVNSLVTQLMAIENKPLDALKSAATALNSKLSTYGKLQSYFSALQDKSNALTSSTLWSAVVASSGDPTAVKVSTDSGAAAGNYSVQVNKLAAAQTVTAAALPSSASTLNEGTLSIELGAWTEVDDGNGGVNTTGFTAKSGSTPITVAIGAGDTSLASIRDKINAAGAGVVASIVNDANGARLSLRSKETGAENGFRISAAETVDDGVAGTGLSALAFDAAGGSSNMLRSRSASNAEALVNGIAVSSASNTLNNVVDGMTLTLAKVSSDPVEVSVATDTEGAKKKITDFVSAYNDLASYLRTQTTYNDAAKTGGPLQGDQGANALQRQLRDVLNQASTASGTYSRLSDIGVTMQRDGTLAVDDTKLSNAVTNLPELKKLLATDGAENASSGFVRRWKRLADSALGLGGTFESRTEGLNASLRTNSKNQDSMSLRLSYTENRMRAQYTALDTQMAKLNNLSAYMTQQITLMNASKA